MDRTITEDHQIINDHFKSFYSKLYASNLTPDHNQFGTFFAKLNTLTIDSDVREELEQNLKPEEIITAIMSLQSGKTPGPDGFPTEFYKRLKDKVAPLFLAVYTEALEKSILPPILLQAFIILLLKKNKNKE